MSHGRTFSAESYATGTVYNHTFERQYQEKAVELLREIFPSSGEGYYNSEGRKYSVIEFISLVGAREFQKFSDDLEEHNRVLRSKNTLRQMQWAEFISHLPKVSTKNKAGLFKAIYLCGDSLAKFALASMFCRHVLAIDRNTAKPLDAATDTCIKLINLISAMTEPAFLSDPSFPVKFEKLITGKNLEYFQSFYILLLGQDNDPVANLQIIHQATDAQVQFCVERKMDFDFLVMLVENKIDRRVAANAGGQLVAVSPEAAERAKIEACDKLGAVEAAFALYSNNAKAAMDFFRSQQAQLLALNTEMLGLFTKYAKEIANENDRKMFLRVLSKAKTHEDNNFNIAIFEALDLPQALQAMKNLDAKSHKSLSVPQKLCITIAFASKEATSEEKANMFEAIFAVNFPPKALEAIAKLYVILLDRPVFIAALKSLKPNDNLLTGPCIEILELLHKKNVAIDFEYAKHLSTFPYLIQFKEYIEKLSDNEVQAVFNKDSKLAKGREWIRALQVQAQASQNPLLQWGYMKTVFRLWSFAEANALEVGLNRQELLGSDFNEYFCEFLMSIDLDAEPRLRNALLASVRTSIGLIMPSSVAALPSSSSSGVGSRLLSWLGSSSSSSPRAIEMAPPAPNVNLARLFQHLGVLGLDGTGRDWRFPTEQARLSYANFQREADIEMLMLEPGQTYLDLVDPAAALGGPQVEELTEEQQGAPSGPRVLSLEW